jgi:hypothetical protein
LQAEDFALLVIDTGVLRTVDEKQWSWIERALGRSRGEFIMAIVGHPRFAGGQDLLPTAEDHDLSGSSGNFAALYLLLARHNVRIAMAGDTHNFEYYREKIGGWRGAGDAPFRQWWGLRSTLRNSLPSAIGRSIRRRTVCATRWTRRCRCGSSRLGTG